MHRGRFLVHFCFCVDDAAGTVPYCMYCGKKVLLLRQNGTAYGRCHHYFVTNVWFNQQNSINNNFIGGIDVTIGVKVNQVLASLESATAELKTFALDTQDKNAQKMFSDYSKQLEEIKNGIKGRVNYLEQQEPQYKVFEQQEQ
jgi:hypothetical protein